MANVPRPESERRFWTEWDVAEYSGDESPRNIQQVLFQSVRESFPVFSKLMWFLLALVVTGFVALHVIVALHWAYPEFWLSAAALDNLEQKMAMLWSRVGGWVIPLAYFVWQVLSTRRE